MAENYDINGSAYRKGRDLLWISILCAASLYVFRFGYHFGFSDQDEFLPYLLHFLNPDLLSSDWLVNLQSSTFNIRTVFVRFLSLPAGLLGIPEAVHVVYWTSFLVIGVALYRIGLALHRDRLLAALGVIVSIAITARWNPGGNDILYSMLVPSVPAWALALTAVSVAVGATPGRLRITLVTLLLALSTCFQLLVGIQVASVLFLTLLITATGRRGIVLLGVILFAVAAAAIIVPVASPGLVVGTHPDTTYSAREILVRLRAPHHYLLSEFGLGRWIRLAFLVAVGGGLLWSDPGAHLARLSRRNLLVLTLLLLLIVAASAFVVGLNPISPYTALQPFKLTVLVRVICSIALVGWLPILFLRMRRFAHVRHAVSVAIGVVPLVLAITLYTGILHIDRILPFVAEEATPTGRVHAWVAEQTAANALFAIPPDHTGFSWATRRAQYVNFKAIPFGATHLAEWLARLRRVAPFDPEDVLNHPGTGGVELLERLDRTYHRRRPSEWRAVMASTGIDFVLMRRNEHMALPAVNASYCNERWCVYSESDMNTIDEWRYATN